MTSGSFTFSSIARLNDYRATFDSAAKKRQSESLPVSIPSSQLPTGPVDARTEQALKWSGLRSNKQKNDAPPSFFPGLGSQKTSQAYSYTTPDLDLAYNFVTLQKAFAYRDAVLARNPDLPANLGQNLSTKS